MPRCWVSYPQLNGNEPENHWPTRERQTIPKRYDFCCNLQHEDRTLAIVSSLAGSKTPGQCSKNTNKQTKKKKIKQKHTETYKLVSVRSQHTICNTTTTADAKCNDRSQSANGRGWLRHQGAWVCRESSEKGPVGGGAPKWMPDSRGSGDDDVGGSRNANQNRMRHSKRGILNDFPSRRRRL